MTIREMKVIEFSTAVNRKVVKGGYRVAVLHRQCADSQYDVIPHPAVFRTEARAEAFMKKILDSNKRIDMKNWGGAAYSVL